MTTSLPGRAALEIVNFKLRSNLKLKVSDRLRGCTKRGAQRRGRSPLECARRFGATCKRAPQSAEGLDGWLRQPLGKGVSEDVAIYGCTLKVISRSPTPSRPNGRSIVDATAYCHRDSIKDLRRDKTFSYVREADDLVFSRLMAPAGTADPGTPAQFANLIEATEKRKDARLGRELQLSLPVELSREAQVELVTAFVRDHINAQQLVADVCIHEPPTMDGRGLNPHAHVLFLDRTWGPMGFGRKNRAINVKDWLLEVRQAWEVSVNEALSREGRTERVSCQTRQKQAELARAAGDEAKARELDTPPEPKLGPVLTKRLRDHFLRKQGKLTTETRYGAALSSSGRKLAKLWHGIRNLRNRLKQEAVQWARETLRLREIEALLRVTEPVIEQAGARAPAGLSSEGKGRAPPAAALSPDEIPTLVEAPLQPPPRPPSSVLEVDDDMVLEVQPEGLGMGLERGRELEPKVEPETTGPLLELKPAELEAKPREPQPSGPAAEAAFKEKKRRARRRVEKTSRAQREAERQRVLDAVKGGATELQDVAAKAELSTLLCRRRLRELEREGLLRSDGGSRWVVKGPSMGRDFDIDM